MEEETKWGWWWLKGKRGKLRGGKEQGLNRRRRTWRLTGCRRLTGCLTSRKTSEVFAMNTWDPEVPGSGRHVVKARVDVPGYNTDTILTSASASAMEYGSP